MFGYRNRNLSVACLYVDLVAAACIVLLHLSCFFVCSQSLTFVMCQNREIKILLTIIVHFYMSCAQTIVSVRFFFHRSITITFRALRFLCWYCYGVKGWGRIPAPRPGTFLSCLSSSRFSIVMIFVNTSCTKLLLGRFILLSNSSSPLPVVCKWTLFDHC